MDADPLMQTPLEADPPSPDARHVTCDACWEFNPIVNRMTHASKNITLPRISFAGGKDQRTSERDQRKNFKHQRKFSLSLGVNGP